MANSDPRYKMIYAVPNGGIRNKGEAIKLKKEGVKAGVWDVSVDVPCKGKHGMRLEFKSEKGKLSPEQKSMGELYERFGYATSIIQSFEQFRSVIQAYFYEPSTKHTSNSRHSDNVYYPNRDETPF